MFEKIGLREHAQNIVNAKSLTDLKTTCNAAADAAAYAAAAAAADAAYAAAAAAAATADATAADADATAAAYAYDADARSTFLTRAIPILERAIRLGPNGFDEIDRYMKPAQSLGVHAKEVLCAKEPTP